jgi:hypothetical protein
MITFAKWPPEDTSFLITRLWDKYLPAWRSIKAAPPIKREDGPTVAQLNEMSDSPDLKTHTERDLDALNYVTVKRQMQMCKGRYQRFTEEQEQRMREHKAQERAKQQAAD